MITMKYNILLYKKYKIKNKNIDPKNKNKICLCNYFSVHNKYNKNLWFYFKCKQYLNTMALIHL